MGAKPAPNAIGAIADAAIGFIPATAAALGRGISGFGNAFFGS